jgi:hypothetical protein
MGSSHIIKVKNRPICYVEAKEHQNKMTTCLGCMKCFVCPTKGDQHFAKCPNKEQHKEKFYSLTNKDEEEIPLSSDANRSEIEAPLNAKIAELQKQLSATRRQYKATTDLLATQEDTLKELRLTDHKYQTLVWAVKRFISSDPRHGLAERITIAEEDTVFSEEVYDWKDELECYTKDSDLNDLPFPYDKVETEEDD